MKKCLFDANAFSLFLQSRTPEQWYRIWEELRMRQRCLILIEPVVSEMYYKNITFGKKKVKDKILWLKSLRTEICSIDDNDAINAGEIKINYSSDSLSLVDCFLLSIAKKQNALILTTDPSIRDVAKKLKIDVSFFPFEKS